MKRIFQIFKSYPEFKGGLFSGILIGTSYIPFPPWALLFCFAPLWVEILTTSDASPRKAFRSGWWTQFVLTLIGFHWIAYVSKVYGFLPWPVAIFLMFLFAAAVHIYIPLACGAAIWLRNYLQLSQGGTLIILASLTALGEMFWPSMFPWNLGYPLLWIQSPLAQTADHIGFAGLSYLMLMSSALLAYLWIKKDKKIILVGLGGLGIGIVCLHLWGQYLKGQWSHPTDQIQVLQVQANIGNLEKVFAEKGAGFQQDILNQYFGLTEKGLQESLDQSKKVDLVIWPETAFPDFLNPQHLHRTYSSQFSAFLQKIKTPVLTGGYSKYLTPDGKTKNHNALFLYDGQGLEMSPPYNKTNLLVFGEYVPLGDTFPILKKLNPGGEGWDKGSGPQIMNFGSTLIGPQICYESLYPEFSRKLSQLGAELIVNVTNDSWFGPTFEPHQHLYMTLARGIEMRRPLLRNTNTGITTAILANGTILQKSKTFEPWVGRFEIPYLKSPPQSFYSLYGAWLPLIILLIIVLVIILGRRKDGLKTP